jgi:hypothetical protein
MLDALINGGFLTASQSRRMEDDEIVRKYNEHFSDEEEESELDTDFDPEDNENEDENEDFDPEDDKNEDENEEEEDEASYVEIDLPASCFEGLPRLPKNEATDLTNEMVEALELDALFPGVVFDYSHKDKELELAFVAFANNENGDPCICCGQPPGAGETY